MNKILRISLVIAATTLLAACAQSINLPAEVAGTDRPGFWWGLWNGITLPFAFIGSLFNSDIAIYAISNSGGWYDFGFALGASATLSGGASARR